MSDPEAMVVESLGDLFDLLAYADRMAAEPHSHVWLSLLCETAHDARAYAHSHYDTKEQP